MIKANKDNDYMFRIHKDNEEDEKENKKKKITEDTEEDVRESKIEYFID